MKSPRPCRVRIVSRIFAPEVAAAAFRLKVLADAFSDLGSEVDVITTRTPPDLVANDGALHVKRWPVLRDGTGNVRGYVQYLSFDIPLIFRLVFARHDLTVVEPPPTTGAVVRLVSGLQRRPYVYYAADVWTDGAASMGAPGIVVRILRFLEAWVLRGATQVLCVSEQVAERVEDLGVHRERCTQVGNGVDTAVFSPHVIPIENGATFVYTGTMSEWQGAEIFIYALSEVRKDFPYARIAFLGQGSATQQVRALADQHCPGGVEFCGVVSPPECARWIRAADASLVSVKPHIGYDFAKPTKIYAAAACATPVVFAGVGAGQELVSSAGLGWAPGYQVNLIAEAMAAVLRQPTEQAEELGRHCMEWAELHASLRVQGVSIARTLLDGVELK